MNRWIFARFPMAALATIALLLVTASLLLAAADTKTLMLHYSTLNQKREGSAYIRTLSKAKITQDDATFTAETIVMRSEGSVHNFTCTGNPVFTDPEARITSEKVEAQSTPRMAKFIGRVQMVTTPIKKDAKAQSDAQKQVMGEPSTTTCDVLMYDYSKKLGKAQGTVVVVQKERTVWADEATYDQNLELVTLKGNVRMKNTGKEEVKEMKDADTVTVSLENDWMDIVAKPGSLITTVLEVQE